MDDQAAVDLLLAARTTSAIASLRGKLPAEQAKRVIRSPRISPLDRAAILLAKNFGGPARNRWEHGGDAEILLPEEVPDFSPYPDTRSNPSHGHLPQA